MAWRLLWNTLLGLIILLARRLSRINLWTLCMAIVSILGDIRPFGSRTVEGNSQLPHRGVGAWLGRWLHSYASVLGARLGRGMSVHGHCSPQPRTIDDFILWQPTSNTQTLALLSRFLISVCLSRDLFLFRNSVSSYSRFVSRFSVSFSHV